MTARLLVVEDEPLINQAVTDRLRAGGMPCARLHGPDAVAAALEEPPDALVPTLMLPGFWTASEVCRRVQSARPVPSSCSPPATTNRTSSPAGVGADDISQALPDAGSSPGSTRCCAGSSGHVPTRREAPVVTVGSLVVAGMGRAGSASTGDPPDPDRVRLARRPRAAAPGTVLEPGAVTPRRLGWADALGTRTVDSHIRRCAPSPAGTGCGRCTGVGVRARTAGDAVTSRRAGQGGVRATSARREQGNPCAAAPRSAPSSAGSSVQRARRDRTPRTAGAPVA